MSRRKNKCFIDCSETVFSGNNTGIQRTVWNIIGRCDQILTSHGIEVFPVVSICGAFYAYSVESDRKICTRLVRAFFGTGRDVLDRVFYGKKFVLDDSAAGVSPYSELPVTPRSEPDSTIFSGIHYRIVEVFRGIIPLFFRCSLFLDNALNDFSKVDIEPDDIIFYPDAFWYSSTCRTFARYDAVKILLIHDIIPIKMPELCDPVYVNSYKHSLGEALKYVDGIISISNSELVSIRSLVDAFEIKSVGFFDYNYWGADFATANSDVNLVSARIAKVFDAQNAFIMVGTIEPRKNHTLVLDAFDRYWQRGGGASLCIIGKTSHFYSDVQSRIEQHEYFGVRLFCFDDVNDQQLAYCYEKCAGVVFASRAEGFGLPLVEAMWYGIPVLASDIDVFREIGGDYPEYFSPDDAQRLADLLQLHDSRPERREPCQWRSWDESVRELFAKVFTMANMIRSGRNSA